MTTRSLPELAARLTHLADSGASGVPDAELLHRFAGARDEAAFELLVWRHSALVLGTCRRVLGRSADADDAFQAVFLALARKAGSVRSGESLPGWLHRVALRTAIRLRATAGRLASFEPHSLQEVAAPATPLPDDTAAVLDEEIGRLPDKLRVTFVLCELEGRTDAEVAAKLGCPRGTVLSRLARARERLRARLTRRGLAVAATGVVIGAPEPVTAAFLAATARASVSFVTGQGEGAASGRAISLARGVLRTMKTDALKPVAAVLAVVAVAVGAALAALKPAEIDPPPNVPSVPAPRLAPVAVALAPPVPARNFKLATQPHVYSVCFSPDSKWLVTPTANLRGVPSPGESLVWDTATGKRVRTEGLPGAGPTIGFSPDGKLLATARYGGGIVLISTETWKDRGCLSEKHVASVSFSPDSKFMVGVTGDGAKVWEVATGKPVFEQEMEKKPWSVFFSPDGRTLAVCSLDGAVRLLDPTTGRLQVEIRPSEKWRSTVTAEFSPDGRKLVTRTGTIVKLWDTVTGKELQTLFEGKANRYGFIDLKFSPNGKQIVAIVSVEIGSAAVWVWDVAGCTEVASFPTGLGVLSLTADGAIVAVNGESGKPTDKRGTVTVLYQVKDGKELARLPGADDVVFAPDGKTVAILNRGDRVVVKLADGFSDRPSEEPNEVLIRDLDDLLKPKRPGTK